MKIIITATGTNLESEVDPRFGRAQYFLLVDTETEEILPIDNDQNLQAASGAGIQSAEAIVKNEAEVLLTGHCGPKAFRALTSAGVKIVHGVEGSVKTAIDKFKKGEYQFASSADVASHW